MQWFYDLKTIHKMCVLISVMAVGMITTGYTGYYFDSQANQSLGIMYNNNLKPIMWINLLRADLNANKANQLSLILEDDPVKKQEYIQDIKERAALANKNMESFKKAMQELHNEKALSLLDGIKEDLVTYRSQRTEIITLALANQREEAFKKLKESEPVFQSIIKNVNEAADNIADRADNRYKKNLEEGKLATILILTISLVSLALCILLGFITANRIAGILGKLGVKMTAIANGDLTVEKLGRPEKSCIGDLCVLFDTMLGNLYSLVKEVNQSVEEITAGAEEMNASVEQTAQGAQQVATSIQQLASGSNEMASGISQLSEGSRQVAASITQLAAGVDQISKSVENGANNISSINKAIQNVSAESVKVAKLGNDTEDNANIGKEHIKKAVNKIDSIRSVSGEISSTIGELGTLSSEIEQIVDLIKNIAGQTNLLALNAAIEAARAGEHGKGFAVVADEVKKLASQSGEATDKITGMIKVIQNKTQLAVTTMDRGVTEVEEGVLVINDAGSALENIIDQVKQANSKIQSMTKEIDAIAKGSEDLVNMVQDISSITEETAASAEEIASITEQTAANSQEISSTIQQSAAGTEEISSIVEEQTASLEEINASSNSLAKVAEGLQKQASMFKV